MPATLSIIIPTPDGKGLHRCIRSILQQQLIPGDEIIVVGDTESHPLTDLQDYIHRLGDPFRYVPHAAGYHAWGHPQINVGIEVARGDYLVFNDDDDIFCPDAFSLIRQAVTEAPYPLPHLFRFVTYTRVLLWQEKIIQEGLIGGHQFVPPNIPARLGQWTDRYNGDFDFIQSTLVLWPHESVVWRPEVISFARPDP